MTIQRGTRAIPGLTAVLVAIGVLAAAGCDNKPAPEPAAKPAVPASASASATIKVPKAEPPRVDPAAARDAALAAAVKAALAADARLKSFAIDIRAANGSVELFGTVDANSSREKAEKIAAAVDGVKSVKNHLVLVSGS